MLAAWAGVIGWATASQIHMLKRCPQNVTILGSKICNVVVPDNQLSLAIGKEGQNARLAAKLTGWKIDIKSESYIADGTEEE